MDWEEKPDIDKTLVHCQAYFLQKWTKRTRYRSGNSGGAAGFVSSIEEANDNPVDRLADNLAEVAIAATADKEHIQQMTANVDEHLQVIKKMQAQLDKLVAQNDKLIDQCATLTDKVGQQPMPNNQRRGDRPSTNRGRGRGGGRPTPRPFVFIKCLICKGTSHKWTDCWELPNNKDKRPDDWVTVLE